MRIVIIDDMQANLDFFQEILSSDFEVETYLNPQVALRNILISPPDLVLVDCIMPGMNGHQLVSLIRAELAQLPIIMISGHRYEENLLRALELMVDDFLFKPISSKELLARIRSKIFKSKRHANFMEQDANDFVDFDDANESARIADFEVKLKTKEYRLFKYLVQRKNQLVTRDEIFVNVWDNIVVSPATLDTHICQLRKRLDIHGNKIITRKNSGFIFSTNTESTLQ